ncbi:MAG: hypothetical protein R2795_27315 [Saprospiraceae bacterium]
MVNFNLISFTTAFRLWQKTASILVGLLFLASSLLAQTTNWTGASNSDWHDAGNWDNGVPTASSVAVLSSGTFFPAVRLGTSMVAQKVTIGGSMTLTIDIGGTLTIDGSPDQGILNNGTINNNGTLNIDNTGENGIQNSATGSITNAGNINIGTNGGALNIGNHGILNQAGGTFTNSTEGVLTIEDTDKYGISNSGTLENAGTLNTNGTGWAGLINDGATTNDGIMNIDDSGSNGTANFRNGINNNGSFTNNNEINIGLNSAAGNIRGYGLLNNGNFVNSGELIVRNTYQSGIQVNSFSAFTNNSNGTITLPDIPTAGGLPSLFNSGSFNNSGLVNTLSYRSIGTGALHNLPCGVFVISNSILTAVNSTIINDGFLEIPGQGNNMDGTHINNGVVRTGAITLNNFTNNEIILHKTAVTSCSRPSALHLNWAQMEPLP